MIRAALRALRALAGLALSLGQALLNWLGSGRNLIRASLIATIFAVCWVALDRCSTAGRSVSGDPFSTEPVQINIGEEGYAVPRNYLSYVRRSTTDGRDMTAVLHVLWPGLEPRSPENAHLWQRRHPTRQVRILINDSRVEGYEQLQNALFNASRSGIPFEKNGEPTSFELLEYLRVTPSGRSSRYLVSDGPAYLTPSGNPIMIDCSDHTTDEAKEIFDVEILCTVDYRLEDGAMLHFTFFLVNLEHWREIDLSVRTLVDSFRR